MTFRLPEPQRSHRRESRTSRVDRHFSDVDRPRIRAVRVSLVALVIPCEPSGDWYRAPRRAASRVATYSAQARRNSRASYRREPASIRTAREVLRTRSRPACRPPCTYARPPSGRCSARTTCRAVRSRSSSSGSRAHRRRSARRSCSFPDRSRCWTTARGPVRRGCFDVDHGREVLLARTREPGAVHERRRSRSLSSSCVPAFSAANRARFSW